MATLKKLSHPNVVQCFGIMAEPPLFCLVMEYCSKGDVMSMLRNPTPTGFFQTVSVGVVRGMAYLHSAKVGAGKRGSSEPRLPIYATYGICARYFDYVRGNRRN